MEHLHKGGPGYFAGRAQINPRPRPGCLLGQLCTFPESRRQYSFQGGSNGPSQNVTCPWLSWNRKPSG